MAHLGHVRRPLPKIQIDHENITDSSGIFGSIVVELHNRERKPPIGNAPWTHQRSRMTRLLHSPPMERCQPHLCDWVPITVAGSGAGR